MTDWRPNWKNPEAYRIAEHQKDLKWWAWQFVRRNEDYQGLWDREVQRLRVALAKSDRATIGQLVGLIGPERMPRVTDASQVEYFSICSECLEEFGFNPLTDPSIDEPRELLFEVSSHRLHPGSLATLDGLRKRLSLCPDLASEVGLRVGIVDLTLPIGEQIANIGKLATEERDDAENGGHLREEVVTFERLGKAERDGGKDDPESLHRERPAKRPDERWPLYLRLLDARAAGASYRIIGQTLFSAYGESRRTAINTCRQAKRWTEPDRYLKLLRLRSPRVYS